MPKQIGWVDEFGNVFPIGAWKPQQKNYLDSHKVTWEPVYTLSEAELVLMNEKGRNELSSRYRD